MEITKPSFEKYIFVCEHRRDDGVCCSPKGELLREALKKKIAERGLTGRVRVSRSGCLDVCAEGPNVLLMPDSKWFKHVSMNDLDVIIHESISPTDDFSNKKQGNF